MRVAVNRGTSIGVFLMALGILFVASRALWLNLTTEGARLRVPPPPITAADLGGTPFGIAFQSSQPRDVAARSAVACDSGGSVTSTISILQLDATRSLLVGAATICVGRSLLADLYDAGSGAPLAAGGKLQAQYRDEAMIFVIEEAESESRQVARLPFATAFPDVGAGTVQPIAGTESVNIQFPFSRKSSLYPDDGYDFAFTMRLMTPPDVVVKTSDPIQQAARRFLDPHEIELTPAIVRSPGILGSDLTTAASDPRSYPQTVALLVQRDSNLRLYTYAMALIPLVIAIVLAHLLYLARPTNENATLQLIAGMAGVLLSVLPLRAVLVPADVQGLTRTDLILSVDLALLVFAAVSVYFYEISRGPLPPARHA